MPIYEYECADCGHRFEKIQKVTDGALRKCEKCKGRVERLISSPAIQFKGTGWYVTDYAKKSGSSDSASEGAKSDASKSDSKGTKKKEKKKAKAASD